MAHLKVLSLGAGVQSTTLALMIKHGELPMVDCALFADTGWEPPNVYHHLRWLTGCELTKTPTGQIVAVPGTYQGGILPFPVHIVQQGNIRDDIEAAAKYGKRLAQPPAFLRHPDGKKGQIRRACTYEYKVRPLERKVRELLGMKPRQRKFERVAERWYGISLDEAHRMKDSGVPYIANRYPLIELRMTRQDCLEWMKRHGYPQPPKSACIGCPYHSDQYWRELRDKQPECWRDAVAVDHMIRHGIPGVKLPAYLHASLVPLDLVDLRSLREKGQLTFFDDEDGFGNECEGLCGV